MTDASREPGSPTTPVRPAATPPDSGAGFRSPDFPNSAPASGPGFAAHDTAWAGWSPQQPGGWSSPTGPTVPTGPTGPTGSAGTPSAAAGSTTVLAAPPKQRRGRTVVGAVVLAALVGAGAGVGSYAALDRSTDAGSPVQVTTEPAAQSPKLDGTVSAAAAKIKPSVVTITVRNGQSGDVGTGIVLDRQGHVLTNDHVVADAAQGGRITVTLGNGTTTSARLVGASSSNDLAVIKIADTSDLTPATFAKSSSLTVGQTVVAAGAPLGLSETFTSGIVSNTARPVRSGTDNDAVYLAVQTDAAINPGNSGGPLVDLNGDVVGVDSAIASTGSSGDSQSGNIGIGFAIPADVATRVAADLIASGSSPIAALGVTVSGSDQQVDTTSTGVALATVTAGSAAAQAGLQAGDVVTKVDDFETTSADGLIAATRYYAPGTSVTLTYTRDGGAPQTVEVTLGTL